MGVRCLVNFKDLTLHKRLFLEMIKVTVFLATLTLTNNTSLQQTASCLNGCVLRLRTTKLSTGGGGWR